MAEWYTALQRRGYRRYFWNFLHEMKEHVMRKCKLYADKKPLSILIKQKQVAKALQYQNHDQD